MAKAEDLPSSRDMKDCHPELQKRWSWIMSMYAVLWPADPLPHVSSTFRSKADQDREVAEGSSKVRWPGSTHNWTKYVDNENQEPYSLGLDFFFIVGGKTAYPPVWMERVVNLSRLVGLFSGKTWGWDLPHLALVEKAGIQVHVPDVPIPELPLSVASNVTTQPVLKYYDQAGTPIVHRGRGDILIRVQVKEGDDGVVVHARYDEGENIIS